MSEIIVSLTVGLCAAIFMHHITYTANIDIFGDSNGATWKLVIAVFVGTSALVYGVIAL